MDPGMFIAVQDRENQHHDSPYWIGITLDVGDGTCIKMRMPMKRRGQGTGSRRTTSSSTEYIDGTRFDEGDIAISVQW
jgi:hypothetical protein